MTIEENTINVSRGEEDKGKIPILDCKGKFDFSFFPDCIKGSKWVTGAVDPVVECGELKDYYINTTTGEVFQKTDKDTWTHIGNMKGSQNAFSNVLVNGVTIEADSETDTVELAAGTNIELIADAANEKVTIALIGQVASAAQADSATSADSAVKLANAHTINGVAFDGSADITITAEANGGKADTATTAESCTGNAATATQLATARTISLTGDAAGSATFDGSADVSISVDVTNADTAVVCTGNAATATKMETARAINGVSFDGTADITITAIANGGNSDTLNGKSASDIIAACSTYMPVGGIIMWSGSVDAIPTDWALCNGENNTPDLRDKFVLGAGSSYAVNATGGEITHTLTITEMPCHTHTENIPIDKHGSENNPALTYTENSDEAFVTFGTTSSSGGDQPHNNMPPYYALAYIMRIS